MGPRTTLTKEEIHQNLLAYKRKWYILNHEKCLQERRSYKEKHRKEIRVKTNKYRDENRDYFRQLQKSWDRSKRQYKDDEKYAVHKIFNNALRRGEILKPECCSQCGERTRLHGHHPDYSNPLAVLWLCPLCHGKAHRLEVAHETATA